MVCPFRNTSVSVHLQNEFVQNALQIEEWPPYQKIHKLSLCTHLNQLQCTAQKFKTMKKIIFVEKADNASYDPVSTFFANRKTNSTSKPPVASTSTKTKAKVSSFEAERQRNVQPSEKELSGKPQKEPRMVSGSAAKRTPIHNNTGKTETNIIQTSIGRKGDHLPYDKDKYNNMHSKNRKEETVYQIRKKATPEEHNKKRIAQGKILNTASSKEIKNKKQTKESNALNTLNNQDETEESVYNQASQHREQQQRYQEQLHQKLPQLPGNNYANRSPPSKSKINLLVREQESNDSIKQLKKKIKNLERNEEQYIRKINELQEREQKLVKSQQKLTKMQKQHKNCTGQIKRLAELVRSKEEEMRKVFVTGVVNISSKDGNSTTQKQIKFVKRRQILLQNQISNLKKTNRELVSRIKNYKGGDMVQMAASKNKNEILNQCQEQINQQGIKRNVAKLESLCSRMAAQMQSYLTKKASKSYEWTEQQKVLCQIVKLFEQVSIECLINQDFQFEPVIFEESVLNTGNLYNQIENYRKSISPIIENNDLAFAISEQNIQLINEIQQMIGESKQQETEMRTIFQGKQFNPHFTVDSVNKSPQKNKRNSELLQKQKHYEHYIKCLRRSSNFYLNLLAHSLCEQVVYKECVTLKSRKIGQEIQRLKQKLLELHQIVKSGTGNTFSKEALVLFVETNIDHFALKVPELETKVKGLQKEFQKIGQAEQSVRKHLVL